ncbi:MAG: lipoate--protein ligase, partial [Firmicutes bacterium]|nr:lipoate--protein ligase [Bacillota bacterium]
FEEYLLKSADTKDNILYLWQNENTVVIGRNQNPWKECNLKTLKKNKGKIVRRLSGGGAVYHDLGNLNFTFISKESENRIRKNVKIIIKALNELNIDAYFSGKNDILVDGYKISGNAFLTKDGLLCHHGTLLVDTNIERMIEVLNVSKVKLKSKGIDSVKSRITNLVDIKKNLNISTLKDSLIKNFCNKKDNKICFIDKKTETNLENLIKRYNSWDWNFGSSPQFDINFNKRFLWGEVDINLSVEDGVISNVKVYTDSNNPNFSKDIESILMGVKFEKKALLEELEKLEDKNKANILNWFKGISI